jgi:hypothetical protein
VAWLRPEPNPRTRASVRPRTWDPCGCWANAARNAATWLCAGWASTDPGDFTAVMLACRPPMTACRVAAGIGAGPVPDEDADEDTEGDKDTGTDGDADGDADADEDAEPAADTCVVGDPHPDAASAAPITPTTPPHTSTPRLNVCHLRVLFPIGRYRLRLWFLMPFFTF